MYQLLIKLMLAAALLQLGLSASDIANCRSRQCFQRLEAGARSVLHVPWKPISLFPEEARRFRQSGSKGRGVHGQ